MIDVKAGDVVVTQIGVYQHWSLVSDQLCDDGKPMLISATRRSGTVKEETWEEVTQGRDTYLVNLENSIPVGQILSNARQEIDQWQYNLKKRNCEHFVKASLGLDASSKQVRSGIAGSIMGAALVSGVSKFRVAKVLASAATGLAVGVIGAKAERKNNTDDMALVAGNTLAAEEIEDALPVTTENDKPEYFEQAYTEEGFWAKTRKYASVAGEAVLTPALKLYYSAQDADTPTWAKTVVYGGLGYFISPIDSIPDLTPMLGYTDDMGVLAAAVTAIALHIKDEHEQRAKQTLGQWFGGKEP